MALARMKQKKNKLGPSHPPGGKDMGSNGSGSGSGAGAGGGG